MPISLFPSAFGLLRHILDCFCSFILPFSLFSFLLPVFSMPVIVTAYCSKRIYFGRGCKSDGECRRFNNCGRYNGKAGCKIFQMKYVNACACLYVCNIMCVLESMHVWDKALYAFQIIVYYIEPSAVSPSVFSPSSLFLDSFYMMIKPITSEWYMTVMSLWGDKMHYVFLSDITWRCIFF